ncbi:EAL domain-containing protein [Gayadomonas joobiniege]|uniref:EAL domain-containing protein n=1 Tax=Gayadomonas joobiniege TaxID=1234606 RepID=UPI00138AD132|nr:EAL domain-containing protein [Gayadomonas joobiniege]
MSIWTLWSWNRISLNQQHIESSLTMLTSIQSPSVETLTEMLSQLHRVNQVSYQFNNKSNEINKLRPAKWLSIEFSSPVYRVSETMQFQVNYTVLDKSTLVTSLVVLIFVCGAGFVVLYLSVNRMRTNFTHIERKARRLFHTQIKRRSTDLSASINVFEVINSLLEELVKSRSDQARIDKFFRAQSFLDPQTGIGNRVFFENHLGALLSSQEVDESGALVRIRMQDLELLIEKNKAGATEFLSQFTETINQLIKRHPDWVFARFSEQSFVILTSNIGDRETEKFCKNLFNHLSQLRPMYPMQSDNWLHIGVARYQPGDSRASVMQETDSAVRAAQLQNINSWVMYEQGQNPPTANMGSVQWRTLLESRLQRGELTIIYQPVVQITGNGTQLHHYETLLRLADKQGNLLNAPVFMPQASQCGLQIAFEKLALNKILSRVKSELQEPQKFSINLSEDALMNDEFKYWLIHELTQTPALCQHLMFEISESVVCKENEQIEDFINQMSIMKVTVIVDQVGRFPHNSDYLNHLPIALVKLHSSIIRNLQQKTENQIFIRSLQGACMTRDIDVFAFGVESEAEWQTIIKLNLGGAQGNYFNQPNAGQYLPEIQSLTSASQ